MKYTLDMDAFLMDRCQRCAFPRKDAFEMKKVAVIWSSPNTDGLTASAKSLFIAGLAGGGAEIEEIHLNSMKLEHCRACGNGWGTCNKTGACVIQDDFERIYQTIAKADGIVWISAVYWSDMTECF